MKVALVHEWLSSRAGSERVLEALIRTYPDADLFVVVDFLGAEDRGFLNGKHPKTTFIQRLPFARAQFRHYLPLMPLAIEQLDLRGYDLVLSSHHAVAKGVITGPDQLHISYVHSPMRYAWDLQAQYLKESGLDRGLKGLLTRYLLHRLRLWDVVSAHRVDAFIANSNFIQRRIARCYRREASVIYPPVRVEAFDASRLRDTFYLAASRLVPYKRMDLIVEAFSRTPERQLMVIGDGPDLRRIQRAAAPNVTLLGFQPDAVLKDHLERCRAFVFAAEEDFGILPVEAQAAGAPVIAFGKGGVLETVIPAEPGCAQPATGLFFEQQTVHSLLDALERFEALEGTFDAATIRQQVERFSERRFVAEISAYVAEALRTPDRNASDFKPQLDADQ